MPLDIDLSKLTDAEKDDLILRLLPLIGQLEAAHARIAELEKRLTALEQPPKNPTNSSNPPSTGEKPNLPDRGKKPRRGHPGVTRALAEHPDRIIEATLAASLRCLSNGCAAGTFGSYARIATMCSPPP